MFRDYTRPVYLMRWRSFASVPVAVTAKKKPTIYQVTIMLATSKSVVFPGHNYLLTTGADDPKLD